MREEKRIFLCVCVCVCVCVNTQILRLKECLCARIAHARSVQCVHRPGDRDKEGVVCSFLLVESF